MIEPGESIVSTAEESAKVRVHLITEDILNSLIVSKSELEALKARVLELEMRADIKA